MGYSPAMDAVLSAIHQGKDYTTYNGRKTDSRIFKGLERRRAIEYGADNAIALTKAGRERAEKLAENIDQVRDTTRFVIHWDNHWTVTFDYGEADHIYWDKARRGDVRGLEIAGLFLKPLASKKAAWVMGQIPKLKFENAKAETEVTGWFADNHPEIVLAMEESANLGDMYIVVNPDLTLTLVPPHVVTPIVDEKDYSRFIGWRIQQVYGHPSEFGLRQTITDEFTLTKRTRTIQQNGVKIKSQTYDNLLPMIPVVHIPNNQRANEIFGHPEGEALLKALFHYNEIFKAGIEGNVKQGRPTPAFTKMGSADNVANFMRTFGRQLVDEETGDTYYEIDFTSDDAVILGESGDFDYKSPGSFTADTMNLLQLLFYLIVQHSELPEFIFGNAIQGNQMSAEKTQLPTFIKWIEKEQGRASKWLLQLVQIVVAYMSLFETGIREDEDMKIIWQPLSAADGKLTLETVQWAYDRDLLTDEVALSQLSWLEIEDPVGMLKQLAKQKEEQRRLLNGENEPFIQPPQDNTVNSPTDDSEDEAEPETETWSRQLSEAAHTGAMVAFEIPLDIATNLALATKQSGLESLAPEDMHKDMHITLCYIGEIASIEDKREAIEKALQNFSSSTPGIDGSIGGVGRFNASNTSDGQDVIYASFDSPALVDFRQSLVAIIESTGVEISRMHGFTPHITLAYVDKDTKMPNLALETMALRFDEMVLVWGDERKAFKLKQNETQIVAELAV